MKNKKCFRILLSLILLSWLSVSYSQSKYYKFTKTIEAYESMSGADVVFDDSAVINSNPTLIQARLTSMHAFGEPISGNLFAGRNGFVVANSDSSDFAFDPFNTLLRSNGESEFRVKLIEVGQDSALEVEWYKFGMVNHPDSDYITFKARVFYTKELIEYFYGPSNISTSTNISGPFVLIIHFNKGFTNAKEQVWLHGDPSNPLVANSVDSLDAFPDSGTVFRFTVKPTGLTETNGRSKSILVYPNPAEEWLTIKSEKKGDNILLVDQLGRISRFEGKGKHLIDLSLEGLEQGIYFLIVNFDDGTMEQSKVIIK